MSGLVSNLLANVLFWLGLGAVAWLATLVARRRFLRFFGLDTNTHMTIYLSNLWERQRSTSPIGFMISLHEFRAAQSIDRLFGDAPLRLPELVRGLIDGLWIHRVPRPTVEVSPPDSAKITVLSNAIVVGAATRNSLRAVYLDSNMPLLMLDQEERSIRTHDSHLIVSGEVVVTRGARAREVIPHKGLHLAVVEKLRDPESGGAIFFCAGVRGDTSWAASEYLVRNWKRLQREFRGKDFALCLGFAVGSTYLDRYVEPRRMTAIRS